MEFGRIMGRLSFPLLIVCIVCLSPIIQFKMNFKIEKAAQMHGRKLRRAKRKSPEIESAWSLGAGRQAYSGPWDSGRIRTETGE